MKEYKVYTPDASIVQDSSTTKKMQEELNKFAQQGFKIVGVACISEHSLNIFLERDIESEQKED